jgi:hypothetical protein
MALSAPLWLAAVSGCGASLPRAEAKQHSSEQYTVVPYPPPSALVEIVPESPDPDAVWVDGYWSWGGRYYVWERGGWVIPQPGAHVCKWSARYEDDGTLMYAPTTWHASSGERIEPPRFLLPAATPPASETAEPATVP